MTKAHRSFGALLGPAAAIALLAAAPAARGTIVGSPLTVWAYGAGGLSTSWTLPIDSGTWNGNDWSYDSGSHTYEMWAGGTLLGTISNLHMDIFDDPQVVLNFTAQANSSTTKFVFSSALVTFAPLVNPTATASAGVTITDNNGDSALLSGLQSDGGSYWANYNGTAPAGTNYASFFPTVTASSLQGTNSDSANQGPNTLPGSVSSMSSQFTFTVSPFDSATGTSNFQIVPAPGALALLGLGGLALRRRR